jgi:DNA-binding MarR family transcriptional regulator/AmiR/NasT family two-component response regulator
MIWGADAGRAQQDCGSSVVQPFLAVSAAQPAPSLKPDDRPTILIAGPMGRTQQLSDWAQRAGLRCIGAIEQEMLGTRLANTIAVDLILIDARGTGLEARDVHMLAIRHELKARLAILTDLDGVDTAIALLDGPTTDLLCEPNAADIVSMLVMAALDCERRRSSAALHDVLHDNETSRLAQLSEEVRRLAMNIEKLTQQSDNKSVAGMAEPKARYGRMASADAERIETVRATESGNENRSAQSEAPSAGDIRAILRARRLREQFLGADLFADPAWDMILDLMAARLAGQRVSVSSLCIAATVPPTTALRWIRQMTERGVFARIDDPADGRRVFIELTDEAAKAVTEWTYAVRRNGGLLPPTNVS